MQRVLCWSCSWKWCASSAVLVWAAQLQRVVGFVAQPVC